MKCSQDFIRLQHVRVVGGGSFPFFAFSLLVSCATCYTIAAIIVSNYMPPFSLRISQFSANCTFKLSLACKFNQINENGIKQLLSLN